jgi:hypothetical protein
MKDNLFNSFKALLILVGLTLSNGLTATTISDNSDDSVRNTAKEKTIYNFELNLWSPDELPDEDSKPAEIGGNYFYLYNPDTITVDENKSNRIIQFTFHPRLGDRYQFRWLTVDHPQYVTLKKKKDHKVKVLLNNGAIADDIYFEVWVLDTLTGEVFMCDPQIRNRGTR